MICNTFDGKTAHAYAAFDFETRMLVDGVALPDADIRRMCAERRGGYAAYPASWWREHCEVVCWAWIIYTPDGLAIAETFEEWLQVIQDARISCGWFYNAPFDFSVLDYAMLSRGWVCKTDTKGAKEPRTFGELANDYGARYTMRISAPYIRRPGDRSKRDAWRFNMHDLKNILHGGLARLLRDFDVRDGDGKPIRKLEMDYQSATGRTDDEIAYMLNDAAGLWWLVWKAGAIMSENYGFDIRGKKPDVLTASGLSKRVLLRAMYPDSRASWHPAWMFRRDHPITYTEDQFFREGGLLGGGLCIVNDNFRGEHLEGVDMVRLDVNSEYPFYMRFMRSIVGAPYYYKRLAEAQEWHGPDACYILMFSRLSATIKRGAVPCWRDPFTCAIVPEYDHRVGGPLLLFLEEFTELCEWYDVQQATLDRVIVYDTKSEPAIAALIDREYNGKAEAKASDEGGRYAFHKLLMNGLGGKYSQNPNHGIHVRTIARGAAHVSFKEIGVEKDEKSLMQVVQGARITAGGRIILRRYAREICGGATNTAAHWVYGDTDSLHLIDVKVPPRLISPTRLGALKRENKTPIRRACFLAPKTYYEIEESGAMELHAKGINTEAIEAEIARGIPVDEIYTDGYRVQSLSALNVRGGKALLPLPKQIMRPLDDDEQFF